MIAPCVAANGDFRSHSAIPRLSQATFLRRAEFLSALQRLVVLMPMAVASELRLSPPISRGYDGRRQTTSADDPDYADASAIINAF
jgi:hypothetical protein